MLKEYYFIHLLQERLRYLRAWISEIHIYHQCGAIKKKVEIEVFKERPIIYLFNYFYFLPINLLNFLTQVKINYTYNKYF